ncbi:hypothetical protein I549_4398 [Mycobacterium avium subsp. avium 2285 (R)]|nr:hypothetical protein I549_4398 [Mycobacterium avium subsp. avium 2285 (R)]
MSVLAANIRAVGQLAAAAAPWVPTRGPSRAGDVTTDWLTTHLGGRIPGARALSATPLDGTTGTTDRRRMTVEWNDIGQAAGMPGNIFIKSSPLSAKNREWLRHWTCRSTRCASTTTWRATS